MGAGCAYRLTEDRESVAYWIDINYSPLETDESGHEIEWRMGDEQDMAFEHLRETLKSLPKFDIAQHDECGYEFTYGNSYLIKLGTTHNADGILIDFDYWGSPENGLVEHNYPKSYHRLMKALNKIYEVNCGYSAWCPSRYEIGELK